MTKQRITSGPIIHDPRRPLRVLGGDPGKTTGLVLVEFRERRSDGSPLWLGAKLLGAATVDRPERDGATEAERDVLFRRKLIDAIGEVLIPPTTPTTFIPAPDIVALEEPLDGGAIYSTAPSQEGGNAQTGQRRDTAFRLGAYYGALLAACAHLSPHRVISFPTRTHKGRRGWMRGNRKNTLLACEALLRGLTSAEHYRSLQGPRNHKVPDHIFMALGVVNHLAEYYQDYFPREPQ